MKKILFAFSLLFVLCSYSQDYQQLIAEGTHTVDYIVEVAERHFDSVGRGRGTGYKPFRRWQYFAERMMDESKKLKSSKFYFDELQSYNARINEESIAMRTVVGDWEDMGPTYWNATSGWNPGVGRITSIAVDDANVNHMIAGSETGGVWKSFDAGLTWSVLTDNLANIDVYALAIDPTNSSTYYWGSTGGAIYKSSNGGATWTLQGSLPGGTVNKILIDPTNTSKLYCSAQGGGLFKSNNGGLSWTRIHNEATNGHDIEFKPGNTNVIYASGSKFFKSIDGGLTFTTANGLGSWAQEFVSGTNLWTTSAANQNNTVGPRTGNALALFYIGNFSGPVTRLVTPSLNLSGAISPQVKFSYTQVNWAGDIDELKVLYKTSLSGNWIELANYTAEATNWTDITIDLPNPTGDYFVAFEGKSNYGRGLTLDDISIETSNSGVVFFDGFENAPNEFASGAKMIGVSPDDPEIVYVVEETNSRFGGFHKSTDSGENFSKLLHVQNYFGYSSLGADSNGQAPRDMDIAVHPENVNDVHIAGINTWRSTNGGVSFTITSQWTPFGASSENIGYCHADVDIMQFVGSGANTTLFVGTDGGIFKASNPAVVNSNYYTDLTPGMGIRQFYRIGISQTDPVIVTGGSQDNGTSVLDETGNWKDWLGADGMEGFVDKNNSNIIYGTTQFGGLNKTTNGGLSRFGLNVPVGDGNWNWIVPFEQDPALQNHIYTAYSQVFKSLDGGGNWFPISQDFGANIDHFKLAPTNSNRMYLAIDGNLWYTLNAGGSWFQSGLNLGGGWINEIAVHPSDPNKIAIATTDSNKVYLSTNGGASFTPMGWDLPNFSALSLAWQNNGNEGLYVGMNYGVYYTDTVLGNTWIPFNNGLPNVRINELEVNYTDGKLYAATYGRGLWRSNLYNTTLNVSDFTIDTFRLYPNPASDKVALKFSKADPVSIRVYNTLGKLMFYAKEVSLTNGFDINVSSYTAGVYFVKLTGTQGEITKKLIIQ